MRIITSWLCPILPPKYLTIIDALYFVYAQLGLRNMQIYTLGTGLRSEDEFVGILKHYQIEALVDVRSYPKSKLPIFNRDYLAAMITRAGMEYHFLGKELGGFRKEGYEKYMTTDAFRLGLDRLECIARVKLSVVVCAEKLPWRCHRRFIATALQMRGWETINIIEQDKTWQPKAGKLAE